MVFICGDTHGQIDIEKLTGELWPEGKGLTKEDYLIVVGDFGMIWYEPGTEHEIFLRRFYGDKPWTTLFIDGNHENFDRLFSDEFQEIDMFGDKVKRISDSIFYLQRGRVYKIDGKTFFTFGGGESIDKNTRTPYLSWWPQEIPTYTEMDLGISNLEEVNNEVDIIVTHTCPNDAFLHLARTYDLGYKTDAERSLRTFLSWVEKNVKFKEWHFGHFHCTLKFGKYYAHYDSKPIMI